MFIELRPVLLGNIEAGIQCAYMASLIRRIDYAESTCAFPITLPAVDVMSRLPSIGKYVFVVVGNVHALHA